MRIDKEERGFSIVIGNEMFCFGENEMPELRAAINAELDKWEPKPEVTRCDSCAKKEECPANGNKIYACTGWIKSEPATEAEPAPDKTE